MKKNVQGMHTVNHSLGFEDSIFKDVTFLRAVSKGKVLRIPCTEELQGHLHNFFTGKLTSWQIVENMITVFLEEFDSFRDTRFVGTLQFEPPIWFKLSEG